MMRVPIGVLGAALLSSAALLAQSPEPVTAKSLGLIVYPAKGQSASQQSSDEQECYTWAKSQTGIDPQAPASAAAAPAESKPGGQRVRSAARGAAAGAIVGEVADNDASEGAKIGATAGVLAGGRKAREDKRTAEEKAKSEVQAAQAEQRTTFTKALGTCLQGRGYTTG